MRFHIQALQDGRWETLEFSAAQDYAALKAIVLRNRTNEEIRIYDTRTESVVAVLNSAN